MDIKIQDTAVQFLPSLGLSCCFMALPYQILTDDSFITSTDGMMHLAAPTSMHSRWNPGFM